MRLFSPAPTSSASHFAFYSSSPHANRSNIFSRPPPGEEDSVGGEADGAAAGVGEEINPKSSALDAGLNKFAEKMPIFEPERVESGSLEKPLPVNLDLALYRTKVLARKRRRYSRG